MDCSHKVSVVVPVYNGERYIRQCLDSIVNQTYIQLEIIVVDDGSKDNSGAICDEVAAIDTRVKVIHQENAGVNSARQKGVNEVSGEWLVFVDADDTLPCKAIETMSYFFGSGCDIITHGKSAETVSCEVYLKGLLSGKFGPELWAKAFSSRLYKAHFPNLDRSIPMGEDLLINLAIGADADKIQVVSDTLYCLNGGNPESVTRTFKRTWEYEKYYFSTLTDLFLKKCADLPYYEELTFLVRKSQLNGIKYIMLDGNKVGYSDKEFRTLRDYFAGRWAELGLSEKLIFKVKNERLYRFIMKPYMRFLNKRKK